jgi:hypothetical protein
MTRIPEGLRRRLEREARWRRRSMNAEIVSRLQESFDIPDQTQDIADAVSSELSATIDLDLDRISKSLNEIQSQNQAILSHLGLPDPVEEAKAQKAEKAPSDRAAKEAIELAELVERPEIEDEEKK